MPPPGSESIFTAPPARHVARDDEPGVASLVAHAPARRFGVEHRAVATVEPRHLRGGIEMRRGEREELLARIPEFRQGRVVRREHAAGGEVDDPGRQRIGLEQHAVLRLRLATRLVRLARAQERANRRDHDRRLQRIGEVAVRAALEAVHAIRRLDEHGGEHDEGNRRGDGVGLDAPADVEAVDVGQLHVEEHEIGKPFGDGGERRLARRGLEDLEARRPQDATEQVPPRLVIASGKASDM